MCLIAFNWRDHPEYKLILVANRDEFFERPSQPLHQWESGFYGGRDLRAGGAWLGLHPDGKFAALTNYRDMRQIKKNAKSRGYLVKDFLEGNFSPEDYLIQVEEEKNLYDGFNLLVGNGDQLFYFSNRGGEIRELQPQLYGLSNALLETPWPKLTLAKAGLERKLKSGDFEQEHLIKILDSKEFPPDELLPDTGMDIDSERLLSSQFISARGVYGTVSSTMILWKHSGEVVMVERTFNQPENKFSDRKVNFTTARVVAEKGKIR